jgi:hypothetical protein
VGNFGFWILDFGLAASPPDAENRKSKIENPKSKMNRRMSCCLGAPLSH